MSKYRNTPIHRSDSALPFVHRPFQKRIGVSFALTCLLVIMSCALPLRAEQVIVKDSGQKWTLLLPNGWNICVPEIAKSLDEECARRFPSRNFSYTHVATRGNGESLELPYLIVQHTPVDLSSASLDQIEKELNAVDMTREFDKIKGNLEDLSIKLSGDKLAFDRARMRTILRFQVDSPVGELKGMSVGFLARDGIYQLNFYALASRFDKQISQFNEIVDHFTLATNETFVPAKATIPVWARGSLIGGVIGGAAGAIIVAIRKRKT